MRRVDLAIFVALIPTLVACNQQTPADSGIPAGGAPVLASQPTPPAA